MKNRDFFTIELSAFRSGLGHDVTTWTHASESIEALQNFAHDILYPSDCGRMILLALKFVKYSEHGDIFQHRREWASSEIDTPTKNSNEPYVPYYSFFSINHAIDGIFYGGIWKNDLEKEKEYSIVFEKSLDDMWKHIEEGLQIGKEEFPLFMDDQQEIDFDQELEKV